MCHWIKEGKLIFRLFILELIAHKIPFSFLMPNWLFYAFLVQLIIQAAIAHMTLNGAISQMFGIASVGPLQKQAISRKTPKQAFA